MGLGGVDEDDNRSESEGKRRPRERRGGPNANPQIQLMHIKSGRLCTEIVDDFRIRGAREISFASFFLHFSRSVSLPFILPLLVLTNILRETIALSSRL